jgi:hypothetical protein
MGENIKQGEQASFKYKERRNLRLMKSRIYRRGGGLRILLMSLLRPTLCLGVVMRSSLGV